MLLELDLIRISNLKIFTVNSHLKRVQKNHCACSDLQT